MPDVLSLQIDRLWVLFAACLVLFMQTGFLTLEVGCVRRKAATITALKNVVDWTVCAPAFFLMGWGLMFGPTHEGWIGTGFWMLEGDAAGGHPIGLWTHFLFQLTFAGTAATIVSGALAERTSFMAYIICSVAVTAVIYPVVGHWAWGNSFFAGNPTLLTRLGFIDFAGSTVVHSVGGWVSLVGALFVGPRLGRFQPDGTVREWEITGLQWTGTGVLILWLCWWGFNGGSTLAMNDRVMPIIVNTNLGASLGGFGAMAYCRLMEGNKGASGKFLNGILAGLVGITAACHMVTPAAACLIGLTSGVLSVMAARWLIRLRIDDPVGAIPVHLFCGVWGTLCVGLFGKSAFFGGHSRLAQVGIQLAGVLTVGAWTVLAAMAVFWAIRRWVGLRVSPREEQMGFDMEGVVTPTAEEVDRDTIRKILEGGRP